MPKLIDATVEGRGHRFGVVVSRFNDAISERLLGAALDTFQRHGVEPSAILVARVPGAFELPLAVQEMAHVSGVDAIVALGAVIRGATPHFDVLVQQVTASLSKIALVGSVPVALGVLTCDTVAQAIERSGGKGANKGGEAALAALEMASLMPALRKADFQG